MTEKQPDSDARPTTSARFLRSELVKIAAALANHRPIHDIQLYLDTAHRINRAEVERRIERAEDALGQMSIDVRRIADKLDAAQEPSS